MRELTMSQPLITVLIDTYNYGRFIDEAINSVLVQDLPAEALEILVVDDGSTDDTAERVSKYAPRVRYLYKPNGGQASAFNLGFEEARGEIVALLDADDYFLPGKLRRVLEEFQKHPTAGMIYHSLLRHDKESSAPQEFKVVEPFSGFLPDNRSRLLSYEVTATSGLTFRSKIVKQLLPIPESIRLQADGFLGLLMVLIAPVIGMSEAFSAFRVHGQNLFHAKDRTISVERQKRQTEMFLTIVKEAKIWTERHRQQLRPFETNLFLNKWLLAFQGAQFQFDPPGRFRFFLYLLRQNNNSPQRTWKMAVVNYLASPMALVFGYKNVESMYKWRGKIIEVVKGLARRFFGAASS
jgi:glycosyltransferase involved in cell wall biosynthesis